MDGFETGGAVWIEPEHAGLLRIDRADQGGGDPRSASRGAERQTGKAQRYLLNKATLTKALIFHNDEHLLEMAINRAVDPRPDVSPLRLPLPTAEAASDGRETAHPALRYAPQSRESAEPRNSESDRFHRCLTIGR